MGSTYIQILLLKFSFPTLGMSENNVSVVGNLSFAVVAVVTDVVD